MGSGDGLGGALSLAGISATSFANIADSLFDTNSAYINFGGTTGVGALYAKNLALWINSTTFSDNHVDTNQVAAWGGAVGFHGTTLSIMHSQFLHNHAPCGAPAVAAAASEAFFLFDTVFLENSCDSDCQTAPINATVVYAVGSVSPIPSMSGVTFTGNTVRGQPCPDIAQGGTETHFL